MSTAAETGHTGGLRDISGADMFRPGTVQTLMELGCSQGSRGPGEENSDAGTRKQRRGPFVLPPH